MFTALKNIKPKKQIIRVTKRIAYSIPAVAVFAYIAGMVIIPFTHGTQYLLDTWANWQSFNAAIIGFTAALTAVLFAYFQYKDKLKRDFDANVAMLPNVLSLLGQNLHSAATYCVKIHDDIEKDVNQLNLSHRPEPIILVPDDQATFKSCLASADEDKRHKLKRLLHKIQIINSRVMRLYPSVTVQSGIPNLLFDIASAYALTMNILCDVRDIDGEPLKFDEDDIPAALAMFGQQAEAIVRQSKHYDKFVVEQSSSV
ncbi:hypothetical protein PN836_017570 [Ningiella sp. W23]|uniref:hypothetical protein n=1 Tax=Ningiella sp. W23 TaxID=3023715 RepID=UPI003757C734